MRYFYWFLSFLFFPLDAFPQILDAGGGFSLIRCSDGRVYTGGYNEFGQLGNGAAGTNTFFYNPVPDLDSIVAVSGGLAFALALNSNGHVYGWGENEKGQLGDSSFQNQLSPMLIISHLDIVQLEAGRDHSLFLTGNGTIYGLGNNLFGKLGTSRPPYTHLVPAQIASLDSIIQVSAGFYHSMALKADSSLWSWGYNSWGQLGHGTTVDTAQPLPVNLPAKVIDFDAGTSESYAVTEDGLVYGWGKNSEGELGNAVPRDNNAHPNPVPIPGISKAVQVEAGLFYALVLRKDGTVWAWGRNAFYELGDSTTTNRYTPVQVKNLKHIHSISANVGCAYAIDSMGVIYSWGSSPLGALASGNDTVKPVPTPVPFSACNPVIGIKDWDIPKPNGRLQVYPNPAQNSCTVSYEANGASNAYLMLTNASNGTTVLTHTLDPQQNQSQLNLSAVSAGAYLVVLVCDGQIVSSMNLQVQ